MIGKTKNSLILGAILIFGYFLSRLINLTVIPVFVDEAIYIRWAQVMRAVASLRFLPLSDGKQPLFMWLVIPFLKIFSDPLFAGRMVSVMSGFGSMAGVGFLSYFLFKKKAISVFAMILYLISPFTFFFDRMALADGLLSCFGIWFLTLAVLLVNNLRFDLAMILGIVSGLGLLTKSPAVFWPILLPFSLLILKSHQKLTWKISVIAGKEHFKKVIKLFLMWVIVYLFGFVIYNILRLGPEFQMIAIRNKDYVFSIAEVFKHPLNPLTSHFKDTISWHWILLTPVVFLSGLIGIFLSFRKFTKQGVFLLLWMGLPLLAQGAVAKVYTARYILFTAPIFLIFSGLAIEKFWRETKSKLFVLLGLIIVFILPLYQVILLMTNPQKAWLPVRERQGYLEMWTAGYGIKESADYIKEAAKTRKVLVGTEGFFGTLPDGLQIYLEKVPDITVVGVGQPITEISPKLLDGLKENRVFLLVNDSRLEILSNPKLKLINRYPKAMTPQGLWENLLLLEIH